MSHRPAELPTSNDPGGIRARADSQRVEVRTFEGALIRIVDSDLGDAVVRAGLADNLKHCVRLKLGIRWLSPRLDRPSGPPDLEQLRRREPERYAELWRGKQNAHTGKGALARHAVDRAVAFRPSRSPESDENPLALPEVR